MQERTLHKITVALLAIGVLSACTPAMLAPDDRKDVCQVLVLATPELESPGFQPHPLSHPEGGVPGGMAAGAGMGALAGTWVGLHFLPAVVLTAPVGAVYGAGYGADCAAAGLSHPTAETDFKEIFLAVYPGILRQALEAELNAPREGCPRGQVESVSAVAPDTVIEIQGVEFGMGCAFGKQQYWIELKWRAVNAMSKRVLGEAKTRCHQTSFREVDDWFADRERARAEIEGVLARTGKWMAGKLQSREKSPLCQFQSSETGVVEAR